MSFLRIGVMGGRFFTSMLKAWRSNWTVVRGLAIAGIVVVALPPIAQYWLRHIPIPEVPASAIVFLVAGALFTLSLATLAYVGLYFLKLALEIDRTVVVGQAGRRRQVPEATEGSFIQTSDAASWQNETIANLKKQGVQVDGIDLLSREGVLTADDKAAIEEMALAAAMRNRGRTE